MGTAVAAIDYVDLGLYLLAGAAAARLWRTSGSGAGAWSAAAFGALAVIVVAGRALPSDPTGADAVVQRFLVALLVMLAAPATSYWPLALLAVPDRLTSLVTRRNPGRRNH